MTAAITNSLLRLDGASAKLQAPFEHPNENMDFYVLEVGEHLSVEIACARISEIVRSHRNVLLKQYRSGTRATLFIEFNPSATVLRLEAPFLEMLGDAGIALECYHARKG